MKKLRLRLMTSYQLGKREFAVICPYCNQRQFSGSYFISALVDGKECVVGQAVTPACCSREFFAPLLFQFRTQTEEAMRDIAKSTATIQFLRRDLTFKKLGLK